MIFFEDEIKRKKCLMEMNVKRKICGNRGVMFKKALKNFAANSILSLYTQSFSWIFPVF